MKHSSRTEISRHQPFLRAHIFLYHAVTKKNCLPYLSCPPKTFECNAKLSISVIFTKIGDFEHSTLSVLSLPISENNSCDKAKKYA